MGRPFDAHMPEVVETDGDRAVALIERRADIHAQARDDGSLDRVAARCDSAVKRSSAADSSPVRNSHSARFSSSAKRQLVPALPASSGSSAAPATR